MTLAEDVAALQARITAAQRERIRAEGARDAAEAAAKNAHAELARDFGVNNSAEAEALLNTLRDEVAAVAAEIAAKLDQIGV